VFWRRKNRETFDQSTQLPQGWQSGITGQGRAKWEVIPEQSAPSKPNVLRQSGEGNIRVGRKDGRRHQGRLCRSKVQAGERPRRSGWRDHLAS